MVKFCCPRFVQFNYDTVSFQLNQSWIKVVLISVYAFEKIVVTCAAAYKVNPKWARGTGSLSNSTWIWSLCDGHDLTSLLELSPAAPHVIRTGYEGSQAGDGSAHFAIINSTQLILIVHLLHEQFGRGLEQRMATWCERERVHNCWALVCTGTVPSACTCYLI